MSDRDFEGFDSNEFEKQAEKVFEQEQEKIRKELADKLVVAFIGNVSSGKSSLINVIFGAEVTKVHPVAGWTKEVELFPHPDAPNLVIADTPGLEDVSAAISARTDAFRDQCDMFLYVLNGAVGCPQSDQRAYRDLVTTGRPIAAVLNKIDTAGKNETEKKEFIETTREQLGVGARPFFVTAADPHPAILPAPVGVEDLTNWLLETAQNEGKGLLMGKALREKGAAARFIIHSATAMAAAGGALPIPGSDYIVLTAIQAGMMLKLSALYDQEVTRKTAVQFITNVLTSGAGKQLYRVGLQALKAAGWFGGPWGTAAVAALAATIAAAITYGLGWAWVAYLKSDFELDMEGILEVFEKAYSERKKGLTRDEPK